MNRCSAPSIRARVLALVAGVGLVAACSGTSQNGSGFGNGTGTPGGDSGTPVLGGGGGGGGDAGPGGVLGGEGGVVTLGDAACAANKTQAQSLPLDMYIMLDQSGSMNEMVSGGVTKWSAVTGAINAFMGQPSATGISVGIQFFGVPANGSACPSSCMMDSDCGSASNGPCFLGVCVGCLTSAGGDSCTAADYAKPSVEIAPLPGVAAPITAAIGMHGPSTSTPTSAALQGAVDHASSWAQAHTGHVVIDVLATDGDPTECDTSLPNIDAIAAAGVSATPKILTFVIGVGTSTANLNSIAAAGGTTNAFIVDTNMNVNQQFLDAMNKIRGAALGCQYSIPLPMTGTPDYTSVNVQYTPGGGGGASVLPQVADKTHCPASGDAWYYDKPSAPKQIILCDATCTKVSADGKGAVDVLTGCKTIAQ